jgi:hypothetical protein
MTPPKGTFDRVLEAFGPKPVRDAQGNIVSAPMTKKGLAAHILAGAITGIISGAQAGAGAAANAPAGPAGTMGPANRAAMAAGGAAGTQAFDNMRNGAQNQYDAEKLRQFNTMKRNIDLHASMISLGRMQHDQMMDALQPSIDTYNQAKVLDQGITDPSKKMILDEGLTGNQAMEKYKGKMSMNDFIPMGTKKMFNSDGSPMIDEETGVQHEEPVFAVINPNATMPATEELKEQLKYMNPNAAKIPLNAAVRLSNVLAANQFSQNSTILQAAGDTWGKELASATGDQSLAKIDLLGLAKTNKTLRDGMKYINNYNHLPIDQALDALGKDKEAQKAAPGIEGVLAHALGMDKTNDKGQSYSEVLGLKRKADLAQQKQEEEVKQRQQDNVERRNLKKQELEDAQNVKLRGLDNSTSTSAAFTNNWKDPKTGTNFDLSHPAMKLVDGTLSPPELSKRATKGSDSYNAIIKAADDYSMAKYGKPYDFAKDDGDYKYFNQKSSRDTMNYITSLTGEDGENRGGTLSQLLNQSKVLGNTTFPDFNSMKNWTDQHIGDPGVPQFQATLLTVADEMAKIMGGGNATVEGIRQAQEILNKSFSNQQMDGAVKSVRGAMANRGNSLVADNRYMTKQYGKMVNPLNPELPEINGVRPVKVGISKSTGSRFYLLPTGVIVDFRGKTVDPNLMAPQQPPKQ